MGGMVIVGVGVVVEVVFDIHLFDAFESVEDFTPAFGVT